MFFGPNAVKMAFNAALCPWCKALGQLQDTYRSKAVVLLLLNLVPKDPFRGFPTMTGPYVQSSVMDS